MQKITQAQASRDAVALGYTAPASTAVTVSFTDTSKNRVLKLEGGDVFIKTGKLR